MTASALARISRLMTGLMLWITSFNCYRAPVLLLLSNVFLKVRVVFFKADATILDAFQCSACLVVAPSTCTSSTINFFRAHSQVFSISIVTLRKFLATESPLKMVKNAFCFNSRALFVLKMFKFLSWIFSHASKRLD